MALEFNISPDDIERLVKDSIMQAGFGRAVTDAIGKALTGYNNPIDEALKRYVGKVAADLIQEKYASEVREAVARHIEARVTKELIDKVTDEAVRKMENAAERY